MHLQKKTCISVLLRPIWLVLIFLPLIERNPSTFKSQSHSGGHPQDNKENTGCNKETFRGLKCDLPAEFLMVGWRLLCLSSFGLSVCSCTDHGLLMTAILCTFFSIRHDDYYSLFVRTLIYRHLYPCVKFAVLEDLSLCLCPLNILLSLPSFKHYFLLHFNPSHRASFVLFNFCNNDLSVRTHC